MLGENEKHTLDYYIPENALSCQCLYAGLGSVEGDYGCSGRTHLLEHLLVSFDKERTEEERKRYIVEAHTTFHYMYFVIYYNRHLITDEEVHKILKDIRAGRLIRPSLFYVCKADVKEEIQRYRTYKVKIFERICADDISNEPRVQAYHDMKRMYVEHLPIGKLSDVDSLTPQNMNKFVREQYIGVKTHAVCIRNGVYHYYLATDRTAAQYGKNMQTIFGLLFYDVIFFSCAFGMGLTLEEFHMTQLDGKLYIAVAEMHISEVRKAIMDREMFTNSLYMVRRRYRAAQEFNMEEQLRLCGECLYAHERIPRLGNVKRELYGHSTRWLYDKYLEYCNGCVIVLTR